MSKSILKAAVLTGLTLAMAAPVLGPAIADEALSAKAVLKTAGGDPAGTVVLTQTPGGVLIAGEFKNLPAGEHGFHIHETGACDPDFKAAGGHFAPEGHEHGYTNPKGYHAGDMPNLFVGNDTVTRISAFNPNVTLGEGKNSVFDGDGSAIIVHEKPDSYQADAGAGGRVACGVIER